MRRWDNDLRLLARSDRLNELSQPRIRFVRLMIIAGVGELRRRSYLCTNADVERHERLGGILNYYDRRAA